MPSVFKSPSPWLLPNGKLEVDWSRAPRGLAACFVGNDFVDIAQHKRMIFYDSVASKPSVPTPRGNATLFNVADDFGGSTVWFNPNAGASMEVLFLCTSVASAQSIVNFSDTVTSLGGQGDNAAPNIGINGSKLVCYLGISFTNVTGATTLVAGRVYHAALTWDGSGNTTLYLDGKSDGTVTGTIQSNASPASFRIGSCNTYLGAQLSPVIMASCANVQWTADEVKQRFHDPFGFLGPAEAEMSALFVAAAASDTFANNGSIVFI